MKSMRPPLAAIFFMTYFHRAGGGGHGPLGPLDQLLPKILSSMTDKITQPVINNIKYIKSEKK